jgi:hypothetical protein
VLDALKHGHVHQKIQSSVHKTEPKLEVTRILAAATTQTLDTNQSYNKPAET